MTTTDSIGMLQRIQATFDQLAAPTTTTKAAPTSTVSTADLFTQIIEALKAQTAATGSPTGDDIVAQAEKFLGTPYVFGGTSESGIDCSGLVQRSLGALGVDMPRVVADQKNSGTAVSSLSEAKPGDLIVLNGGKHIVIYAGNNEVIHAPEPGQVVKREKVWFDDADIVTIRRVVPDQPAASTTSAASTLESLQALISAQAALLSRSISS